nr:MAG TPA: minor capsid protein [Caudoviricetes sp.]
MNIGKQNDKDVEKLEKKLRKIYLQAQADTQTKMEDYLQRFATKDAIKLEQVKRGKITQEEYINWRKGQIAVGKLWQDKVDALAADYTNANKIAMGMVQGDMSGTFATNHNYAAYQLEHDTSLDLSFSLYDEHTLKNLVTKNPDLLPLPSVDVPKDLRWNKQKINSVITQAVLQGDSIPAIAQSLRKVTDMNHSAAIRSARTSMTAAQNAGRVESYKHAQDMGINLQQEWLATLDGRTRHSHRKMDGERISVAKDPWHPTRFSNGCRYPGDPQGPAWEIYNCRCTLVAAIEGIDQSNAPRNSKLGGMSYEEWKNGHKPTQTVTPTTRQRRPISLEVPQTLTKHTAYVERYRNKNMDAILQFITPEQVDEIERKAYKMYEQCSAYMTLPTSALDNIVNTHFMPQAEVEANYGELTDYIRLSTATRNNTAKWLFGCNPKQMQPSDYEKYGFLGNNSWDDVVNGDHSLRLGVYQGQVRGNMYGNMYVKFDKNRLENRVTFSDGDGAGARRFKTNIAGSIHDGRMDISGFQNSEIRSHNYLNGWYDTLHNADDNELKDVFGILNKAQKNSIYMKYFELQFHGDLTIDDVSEVCFGSRELANGVSDKTIEYMQSIGIRMFVRDTGGDIVEYTRMVGK